MATVYLKGGKAVEVPTEQLEDYLNAFDQQIETRQLQRRGGRRERIEPPASSK